MLFDGLVDEAIVGSIDRPTDHAQQRLSLHLPAGPRRLRIASSHQANPQFAADHKSPGTTNRSPSSGTAAASSFASMPTQNPAPAAPYRLRWNPRPRGRATVAPTSGPRPFAAATRSR